MKTPLSHRERVLLALQHQQTDRVPISMIGSSINSPAREELDAYLRRERGSGLEEYLGQAVDLKVVAPRYNGPPLPAGTDIWGVHRVPVQSGRSTYDEIDIYPLAGVTEIDELAAHRWPDPDWFDYAVIPEQLAALRAAGDYASWLYLPLNPFESSWYMFGFERIFAAMLEYPELVHALLQRVTDSMAV